MASDPTYTQAQLDAAVEAERVGCAAEVSRLFDPANRRSVEQAQDAAASLRSRGPASALKAALERAGEAAALVVDTAWMGREWGDHADWPALLAEAKARAVAAGMGGKGVEHGR